VQSDAGILQLQLLLPLQSVQQLSRPPLFVLNYPRLNFRCEFTSAIHLPATGRRISFRCPSIAPPALSPWPGGRHCRTWLSCISHRSGVRNLAARLLAAEALGTATIAVEIESHIDRTLQT
jgi:hypothetical protein